jgi:hypothetical protein
MVARLSCLVVVTALTLGAAALPTSSEPAAAWELPAASHPAHSHGVYLDCRVSVALDSALDLRGDFWSIPKIALTQEKRPAATVGEPSRPSERPQANVSLYSLLLRWINAVWTAVTRMVETMAALRARM